MKGICFSLSLLVLMNVVPGHLHASLWNYVADGRIADGGHVYEVTGNVVIDDTLRLWHDPDMPATEIGNNQYCYLVSRYSFGLSPESSPQSVSLFQGSGGKFYMERRDDSMGDLMWLLDHGHGQWDAWIGEDFRFYRSDGMPCDLFTDIDTLAPYIMMGPGLDMYRDLECVSAAAEITLSKAAPVPEPAALILMCLGLAGLAGCGRKARP